MTATVLDNTDYDVLNVVVLKKMATAETVTDATGIPADEVAQVLGRLAGNGFLVDAGGSSLPTDDAEPALRATADQRYEATRNDPDVVALDEKFETVNTQFLGAMSSWQQIDVGGKKVTNDHSDPDYDEKVIAKIDKLIQRLNPLIEALAEHDQRFRRYAARFETASTAIDSGQHDLVSSPTKDSVHNIWFEFHEDLLRTLGRERVE